MLITLFRAKDDISRLLLYSTPKVRKPQKLSIDCHNNIITTGADPDI